MTNRRAFLTALAGIAAAPFVPKASVVRGWDMGAGPPSTSYVLWNPTDDQIDALVYSYQGLNNLLAQVRESRLALPPGKP